MLAKLVQGQNQTCTRLGAIHPNEKTVNQCIILIFILLTRGYYCWPSLAGSSTRLCGLADRPQLALVNLEHLSLFHLKFLDHREQFLKLQCYHLQTSTVCSSKCTALSTRQFPVTAQVDVELQFLIKPFSNQIFWDRTWFNYHVVWIDSQRKKEANPWRSAASHCQGSYSQEVIKSFECIRHHFGPK
jgi:hypothetical protein